MSVAKGTVRSLSPIIRSIEEAVNVCVELGQLEVTAGDISGLARIDRATVSTVMSAKTRAGCFIRIQYGRYRIVTGVKIAVHLPAAFVAEKAWMVLDAHRDQFLTYSEVAARVMALMGQEKFRLKDLCTTLKRWHRSGYLDREGKRGQYSYRILPGITSRPPLQD